MYLSGIYTASSFFCKFLDQLKLIFSQLKNNLTVVPEYKRLLQQKLNSEM